MPLNEFWRKSWKKQTWAEKQGIPIAVEGTFVKGVFICEDNRVTNWQRFKVQIQDLLETAKGYQRSGIRAVVVGMRRGLNVSYAVFINK